LFRITTKRQPLIAFASLYQRLNHIIVLNYKTK